MALEGGTWSYYVMAGRLYSALRRKELYGSDKAPSILAIHQKLIAANIMRKMDYTDEEYFEIEQLIRHDRDFEAPHFSVHHIRKKYALQNRVTGEEYESMQFTYMRMAMALAENESRETRIFHVGKFYEHLSNKRLSAPTPNFVNLGTHLKGYASCCLYAAGDNAKSLAIGDHIAYMMTVQSAGIGSHISTRSVGEPVRGGLIKHQGRLPYLASLGKAIRANLQNGRGGAATAYYSVFDPEATTIAQLRNPRSTEDKRNRDLHYAMLTNKWFAKKVAEDDKVFSFNEWNAPDLHKAFYSGDIKKFVTIYEKYEADESFKKNWVAARDLITASMKEAFETGTAYLAWADEMNRHTPFLDPIHSSNLCLEICEPTSPYYDMLDLYSEADHGRGEVAMCNLAAVVQENTPEELYGEVCYYALKMIDYCIHASDYPLPHVGFTAKKRMNAGVGMMGVATHMAKNRLRYSSTAGKQELHRMAERHMFHLIKASLKISRERGLAPWMHKTKWPQGWLPIDTYNKNVDKVAEFELQHDWEALRREVIDNGGIGHSVLVAYMPGEASSKAASTTNNLYPVRDLTLNKSDNNTVVQWAAPNSDSSDYLYEIAWDIPFEDMVDVYAIFQKFTDQGISADLWKRIKAGEMIGSMELIQQYLYMTKMGMKTRYYQNSETSSGIGLDGKETIESVLPADDASCESCTL